MEVQLLLSFNFPACSNSIQALEFEKESNNVSQFTIPTKAVARVLGRGGASINEIKDNTEAQIDIDKSNEDSTVTNVTVRGTKKAIEAAKAAILAISDQIADETTDVIHVEQKYHRTLIGAGGQGLRDLVSRCGVDADSKTLASLIRLCVLTICSKRTQLSN
jgi:polyribonucleotide nucleotidyltransferase